MNYTLQCEVSHCEHFRNMPSVQIKILIIIFRGRQEGEEYISHCFLHLSYNKHYAFRNFNRPKESTIKYILFNFEVKIK